MADNATHAENAAVSAGGVVTAVKWGAGAIGALFVNFPKALAALLALMALDYMTGLLAGWATRSLESGAAARGLAKKMVVGGASIAGFFVSGLIPDVQLAGFDFGKVDIGSAICMAFMLSEIISIFENVGRSGYPLPGPLKSLLARLHKMDDDGNPRQVDRVNPAAAGSVVDPR